MAVVGTHLDAAKTPADFEGAPRISEESVPLCPVCGCTRSSPYAAGYDYELVTCRNEWRFVECDACRHVWLNPRPTVAELGVIYPPSYYAYNYTDQIHPVARWGKSVLDRRKLSHILKYLQRAPQSYLDIGCGQGRYLRAMHNRGLPKQAIYGLELDDETVVRLAQDGYQAFCSRVEDCERIVAGSIDLATMFHVIEHVDDPGAVIRRIAQWLSPGGVLALETPNIDSWDARRYRDRFWGGYHIPRHWNLFRPETLQRMLGDAGLSVEQITYQTGHSFWMYSFHHKARFGPRSRPRLAHWLHPFHNLPLLVSVTAFDVLRSKLAYRTSAMLAIARKPE